MHLGIILVSNQLDTLFSMYLFHCPTCFEQPSAHHQENQLYQYIIWYMSLCVGDCLVCRYGRHTSQLHRVIDTRWCTDTIRFSWWWALGCSKHVEQWNKWILWKKMRQIGYWQELCRAARSTKYKILSCTLLKSENLCVNLYPPAPVQDPMAANTAY